MSVHKDKAFSVAAALPVPCYGSLVDGLSSICLHSEERLPFSQNEASSQHIAQQLTLLQQVNKSSSCCGSFIPLEGGMSLLIQGS